MEFLTPYLLLLFTLYLSNLCLISMQEPPSTTPPPPSSSPSSIPTIPPPPQNVPSEFQEKQFLNIIDALIGAGDFAGYANFLSSANPLMLPLKSTLFIPSNNAFPIATASGISLDPLIVAYHIVPQHLTFYDLKQLPVYSRIPTLLSSNFIIITNTSSHFTIDDAEVTDPDLYVSPAFSVHGVSKILDYKAYGSINITFNKEDADYSQTQKGYNHEPKKQNYTNGFSGFGNNTADVQSSSASDISMVFLVWGIFLFS